MQLAGLDLNLLVVLEAALEEQNVARAAKRVHLSPSATSHALARLRAMFGDPLLVKSGRELARTACGEELLPRVKHALAEVEGVFRSRPFDARTLARSFRIITTDHVQLVLLPALGTILEDEAPNVDIVVASPAPPQLPRLRSGEVDLAIRLMTKAQNQELFQQDLFDDELVAVVRKGHPAGRGPWSVIEYASLTHILVSPNGKTRGAVDALLRPHGLRRRVARVVPAFSDAAYLVGLTDMVAMLPRRLVSVLAPKFGLVRVKLPIRLPSFTVSLVWHPRADADPEHRWFRGVVARAAAAAGRTRAPVSE